MAITITAGITSAEAFGTPVLLNGGVRTAVGYLYTNVGVANVSTRIGQGYLYSNVSVRLGALTFTDLYIPRKSWPLVNTSELRNLFPGEPEWWHETLKRLGDVLNRIERQWYSRFEEWAQSASALGPYDLLPDLNRSARLGVAGLVNEIVANVPPEEMGTARPAIEQLISSYVTAKRSNVGIVEGWAANPFSRSDSLPGLLPDWPSSRNPGDKKGRFPTRRWLDRASRDERTNWRTIMDWIKNTQPDLAPRLASPYLYMRIVSIVVDAGVPSAEALGVPVLHGQIRPTAIASAEAFGTPTLPIIPAGIASAEAFGTPTVSVSILPGSISGAEQFGSPTLHGQIRPDSVAPAETFGTPRVAALIQPTSISGAEALGVPALHGHVHPDSIASAEAFGQSDLDAEIDVTAGITSAEAFGTPTVVTLIQPDSIGTAEGVGSPTLHGQIRPGSVDPAEAFGTPLLRALIQPTSIASAEALGTPTVAALIQPTSIGSGESLGAPQVNGTINVTAIASAEAFGTPSLSYIENMQIQTLAATTVSTGLGTGNTPLNHTGTTSTLTVTKPAGWGSYSVMLMFAGQFNEQVATGANRRVTALIQYDNGGTWTRIDNEQVATVPDYGSSGTNFPQNIVVNAHRDVSISGNIDVRVAARMDGGTTGDVQATQWTLHAILERLT